jgi:hypothetical protein
MKWRRQRTRPHTRMCRTYGAAATLGYGNPALTGWAILWRAAGARERQNPGPRSINPSVPLRASRTWGTRQECLCHPASRTWGTRFSWLEAGASKRGHGHQEAPSLAGAGLESRRNCWNMAGLARRWSWRLVASGSVHWARRSSRAAPSQSSQAAYSGPN